MNKTFTLSILLLGFFFDTIAQADLQWVKQMGGAGTYYARGGSSAVDAAGNIFTTGYFEGTADFDPGAGTYNLTTPGGKNDYNAYISKLDASGNFVWALQFGGINDDYGYSIALDVAGNILMMMQFDGTADFDPGPGIYNLTSTNKYDICIIKLDASGNFIWAKAFTGFTNGMGEGFRHSIAVDANGNVYTTGYFNGTGDFDPGAGTYNLTSTTKFDIFISKLDASGSFIWAKQYGAGGTTGLDSGNGPNITVDASGNVYTAGHFNGTGDFDPGAGTYNLSSAGIYDIFISKLDASGDFVWAKKMGGTKYDQASSVTVDASGNVYTTGRFDGTADFDPGAGTYNFTSAGGNSDIFISKLDASGNFVWAKQIGGTLAEYGHDIALDASGNVYITGEFSGTGTVDFDPGAGVYNFTVGGGRDVFISKLDASGNFVWAKQLRGISGGTSITFAHSITVDAGGNIYTTGEFQRTTDFDPGPGDLNLTSSNGYDIFVHKMSQCNGSGLAITAVRDTICAGTPGVLNVTNNPGSIQWQSSVTTGNFINISGATNGNYVSQDTTSTYFRVYSSGGCGTDTSAAFKLVVKQSPVADFINNGTGTQISFTDKSKGATAYNWDFGDSKTSTEKNPVHTYASKGTYHVCLTVLNGSNCSFTICRDIDVDVTVGVNNVKSENKIIISPNPFSNSITIEQREMNNPVQSIEIYDLLGKKVYEQFHPDSYRDKPETEINLSALASSMYFVKVKINNTDYIERVIKQ